MRWFLKIIVGVNFGDSEFLRKEEQFIIVANHNSHLDTMSIMASLPSSIISRVKPVAAADHFGKTKWQRLMSKYFINALLIKRSRDKENPENDPINQMIAELDKNNSLILFPEGTRGKPEEDQALKAGIGLVLSQRPNVKYIPAYMKGMGKAMPKGDSLIVPFSSSLIYGEPKSTAGLEIEEILEMIQSDFDKLKAF